MNFSDLLNWFSFSESGENFYVAKSGHYKEIFHAVIFAVVTVYACNIKKKRDYLVKQGLDNLICIDFKDSFWIKHLLCLNKNHSQYSWISSLHALFLKKYPHMVHNME